MRLRVVCGLGETIATFFPRMRLRSVDLPTLGGPTIAMKPDRKVIVFPPQFFLTAGSRRTGFHQSSPWFLPRSVGFLHSCVLSIEKYPSKEFEWRSLSLHPAPAKRVLFFPGKSPHGPGGRNSRARARPQPALSP